MHHLSEDHESFQLEVEASAQNVINLFKGKIQLFFEYIGFSL